MTTRMQPKRIGGTSFCVADSHVWAEIHYLDSPIDYRECLPKNSRGSQAVSDDEVNLNFFRRLSGSGAGVPLILLICVVLIVTVGWLFLVVVDA